MRKPKSLAALVLGIILIVIGIIILLLSASPSSLILILIGGALCYLGWQGGNKALIIFGHACIVIGCLLVTWGIYLLPYSEPTLSHILGRPLFWGFFSILGGVCANYHGFCRCLRQK